MAVRIVRCSCAALAAAGLLAAALPTRAATTNPPGTAMENKTISLDTIRRQEQALQFTSFDNDAALAIGNRIVEQAKADKVAVTVDVSVNRNPLFFHAMAGTSPNNADWIRRKSNLVNRTGHASFYVHTDAVAKGRDYDNLPTFDPKDYAAHGGSFPIVVKGTGQIGTITVSGLAGVDDHAMVVRALKWYLKADDVPL
ncbi:heme-degrading domain-containing protein [Massilia rhizosphaerae]|uniref:heme-degrading domain-containing protein n=1 Tax=Massilia rhizosphaerae TaxID=2784389 RepID=UPI001E2939EB|nr:heme-degrading domain-containing protein [Massilia rhizosphaerae]